MVKELEEGHCGWSIVNGEEKDRKIQHEVREMSRVRLYLTPWLGFCMLL